MSAEPQKFYIGVIDLFSVLLPGAVCAYLLKDDAGAIVIGNTYSTLPQAEAWSVFLVASYLLGHFVFLIGAALLDPAYDWVRSATTAADVRRLAEGGRRAPAAARLLAAAMFHGETDRALTTAVRLKNARLGSATHAVNAFQWCKAQLMLDHPEALAVVQRFEADSKFFRSLIIVLAATAAVEWFVGHGLVAVVALALAGLAFWRYADQRLKSTNQAYWLVITAQSGASATPAVRQDSEWTHAGGVVVRRTADGDRYLLVTASTGDAWVLPKGHIEACESAAEAAVREVHEETGVWAGVRDALPGASYRVDGVPVHVKFFLMDSVGRGRRHEPRDVLWVDYDTALERATHEETREQLRAARARLSAAGNRAAVGLH